MYAIQCQDQRRVPDSPPPEVEVFLLSALFFTSFIPEHLACFTITGFGVSATTFQQVYIIFFLLKRSEGCHTRIFMRFFLLFFPDFFAYNLGLQCLDLILWLCLIISTLLRSLSTTEETGTKLFTVPFSCWSRKLLHFMILFRQTPPHGIFWLLRQFSGV